MRALITRIASRFQQYRFYWSIRKWAKSILHFHFWKTIFLAKNKLNNARSSFGILRSTLGAFVGSVLYSIAIIVLLESYNYFYPVSFPIDKSAIDTLLIAIASLAGVFLGLYFTAIASIASGMLLRAHQDVKDYFFTSPQGMQYVQTVEITGVISIFYIFAKSFDHLIHPIGLCFLALLSAYIILRFWKVGSDVYNFAQPSSSLPRMLRDIVGGINDISLPSSNWNKDFLQNHQSQRVARILESAHRYMDFGLKEIKLKEEELTFALRNYASLLMFYAEMKSRIPTSSLWYKTKYQYSKWALTDSSQIAMALQTGTTTSPQTIKDSTWFEESVLNNVTTILNHYHDERNYGALFQGHEIYVEVVEVYGRQLDTEAIKLFFKVFENIGHNLYDSNETENGGLDHKERLAFLDSQGRLAIAALLGLSKYLDSNPYQIFSNTIKNIGWSSKRNVYLAKVPYATLDRLESLSEEISNELVIEGSVITAEWYRQSLCLQRYLYALQTYSDFIMSLHTEFFQNKFQALLDLEKYEYSVQLIERWMEFSNKCVRLMHLLKLHLEDAELNKALLDLPWPNFNIDDQISAALRQKEQVEDKVIALLPILQTMVTRDDIPDYFGHALQVGVNACFEACAGNNPSRFNLIFPIVHNASIAAHQRTRDEVSAWAQEESRIIFSTEPLVNLFEISGFARLFSELFQSPTFKETVERTWDQYFSSVQDAQSVVRFISAIVGYRKNIFKIMPQAALRSRWQMRFNSEMQEQGLNDFPGMRGSYNEFPSHPSMLISVFANAGGLHMHSAEDVFLELYLAARPEAVGVELPNRLRESLDREMERTRQ